MGAGMNAQDAQDGPWGQSAEAAVGAAVFPEAVKARCTVLLTDAERSSLEELLSQRGATRMQPTSSAATQAPVLVESGARMDVEGEDSGVEVMLVDREGAAPEQAVGDRGAWEVYYDNPAFALTLRGWWLRERAGKWSLCVPVYTGTTVADIRLLRCDEVTALDDILTRVGLEEHANLWRTGRVKDFTRLLAQANVVPFARLHYERRMYRLQRCGTEGASADAGSCTELGVNLDVVRLDVKYAECKAIAELLFQQGNMARSSLAVAVAELMLMGSSDESREASQKACSELAACVRAIGLNNWISAREGCPRLIAYMRVCRPMHLRALLRAGAIATAGPPDGDGSPQSATTGPGFPSAV